MMLQVTVHNRGQTPVTLWTEPIPEQIVLEPGDVLEMQQCLAGPEVAPILYVEPAGLIWDGWVGKAVLRRKNQEETLWDSTSETKLQRQTVEISQLLGAPKAPGVVEGCVRISNEDSRTLMVVTGLETTNVRQDEAIWVKPARNSQSFHLEWASGLLRTQGAEIAWPRARPKNA